MLFNCCDLAFLFDSIKTQHVFHYLRLGITVLPAQPKYSILIANLIQSVKPLFPFHHLQYAHIAPSKLSTKPKPKIL